MLTKMVKRQKEKKLLTEKTSLNQVKLNKSSYLFSMFFVFILSCNKNRNIEKFIYPSKVKYIDSSYSKMFADKLLQLKRSNSNNNLKFDSIKFFYFNTNGLILNEKDNEIGVWNKNRVVYLYKKYFIIDFINKNKIELVSRYTLRNDTFINWIKIVLVPVNETNAPPAGASRK